MRSCIVGGFKMAVCYNKLWKILIDRGMRKTQLIKAAQISTNAMAKLGKNEDVRVEVLVRICGVLNCSIETILWILFQKKSNNGGGNIDETVLSKNK